MDKKWRWLIVMIFAAAMAWVESAVVLYMRMLIERLESYRQGALPTGLGLGPLVPDSGPLVGACPGASQYRRFDDRVGRCSSIGTAKKSRFGPARPPGVFTCSESCWPSTFSWPIRSMRLWKALIQAIICLQLDSIGLCSSWRWG